MDDDVDGDERVQNKGFSVVEKYRFVQAIVRDQALTPGSKIIGCILMEHANKETGAIYPSACSLMASSGLCKSTVRKSTGDLREKGWFRVKRRANRTNSYFPVLDADERKRLASEIEAFGFEVVGQADEASREVTPVPSNDNVVVVSEVPATAPLTVEPLPDARGAEAIQISPRKRITVTPSDDRNMRRVFGKHYVRILDRISSDASFTADNWKQKAGDLHRLLLRAEAA